jgi:hypothetical protein
MRCIAAALFAMPLLALPALAQNVVVVPSGSEVVIPARGAAPPPRPPLSRPRPNLARPPSERPMAGRAGGGQIAGGMPLGGAPLGGGLGLAAPALIGLPLAAAAAFAAGSLPGGGGGGTTAPARTR